MHIFSQGWLGKDGAKLAKPVDFSIYHDTGAGLWHGFAILPDAIEISLNEPMEFEVVLEDGRKGKILATKSGWGVRTLEFKGIGPLTESDHERPTG